MRILAPAGVLVFLIVAAGCSPGDDGSVVVSLTASALDSGAHLVDIPVTQGTQPTWLRQGVTLDQTLGPGHRAWTTPAFHVVEHTSLRFGHFAPAPVLHEGPVELTVSALDENDGVLKTWSWTRGRNVWRESWLNALARWPLRRRPVSFAREERVNLASLADHTIRLRFEVKAERPPDETVAAYERSIGRRMASPFVILDPKIVARGTGVQQVPRSVVWILIDAWGEADAEPVLDRLRRTAGPTGPAWITTHAYPPAVSPRATLAAVLAGRPASVLGLPLAETPISEPAADAYVRFTSREPAGQGPFMDSLPRRLERDGWTTMLLRTNATGEAGGPQLGFSRIGLYAADDMGLDQIERELFRHVNRRIIAPTFTVVRLGRQTPAASRDAWLAELVARLVAIPNPPVLVALAGTRGSGAGTDDAPIDDRTLDEVVVRVPLILYAQKPVTRDATAPVSLLDLFGTTLEAAGIAEENGEDSRSVFASSAPPAPPVVVEADGAQALLVATRKTIVREELNPDDRAGDAAPDTMEAFVEQRDLAADTAPGTLTIDSSAEPWASDLAQLREWRARGRAVRTRQLERWGSEHVREIDRDLVTERAQVMFGAPGRPIRFQGVVRAEDFESYSTTHHATDDQLTFSRPGRALYFDLHVDGQQTATMGFSTWPPGAPFECEFYANGERIADANILFGRFAAPLLGNPSRVDPAKLWPYLSGNPHPVVRDDPFVLVWLSDRRRAPLDDGAPIGDWIAPWLNGLE